MIGFRELQAMPEGAAIELAELADLLAPNDFSLSYNFLMNAVLRGELRSLDAVAQSRTGADGRSIPREYHNFGSMRLDREPVSAWLVARGIQPSAGGALARWLSTKEIVA